MGPMNFAIWAVHVLSTISADYTKIWEPPIGVIFHFKSQVWKALLIKMDSLVRVNNDRIIVKRRMYKVRSTTKMLRKQYTSIKTLYICKKKLFLTISNSFRIALWKMDQNARGKWTSKAPNTTRTTNQGAWNAPVEYASRVCKPDARKSRGNKPSAVFLKKSEDRNIPT